MNDRTIIYLDGFEIKELKLQCDYVNYKMSEHWQKYQDFVTSEIENALEYQHANLFDKATVSVRICVRPTIVRSYLKEEINLWFLKSLNEHRYMGKIDRVSSLSGLSLIKNDHHWFYDNQYGMYAPERFYSERSELVNSFLETALWVAADYQKRATKKILKKENKHFNTNYINTTLINLLSDYETSKQ